MDKTSYFNMKQYHVQKNVYSFFKYCFFSNFFGPIALHCICVFCNEHQQLVLSLIMDAICDEKHNICFFCMCNDVE